MYSKEESLILISAQSSKLSVNDTPINSNSYPTYEDRKEVLMLVEAGSSVLELPSEKKADLMKVNSYREEEIWALVHNSYDPRNYGKVRSAPKRIGEVRVQEQLLVGAVA